MTRTSTPRKNLALLGGFITIAFGVFVYWLTLSGQSVVPSSAYKINVAVPSAIAIAAHGDVREAGVKIGSVTAVNVVGTHAVVGLAIDKNHAPVFRDATVLVRGKTLIGENYIDVDPGTPAAGQVPDGGTLPQSQAPESTQLDQVLAMLDSKRRADVRHILDVLGNGLKGRGTQLSGFLDGAARTISAARPVTATLAADRTQVASLVADFGRVMRTVGEQGASIRTFAKRGHALAETLASRDAKLRQTLSALPAFLRQTRTTTRRLGTFSTTATPVMANLRVATEQLVPAVAQLRSTADATRGAAGQLGLFARRASPLAAELPAFAKRVTTFTSPLQQTLREVNPFVAYLKPYTPETGAIFGGMRGATEVYDAIGHYTRVGLVVTKSAPVGLLTASQDQALQALFDSGILKHLDTRGYNANPDPGGAVTPKPSSGNYLRVTEDPPYRKAGS